MQTVLITGGTGLIGTALCDYLLKSGYQIIVLTRDLSRQKDKPGVQYAAWDVKTKMIDIEAFKSADFILHLAGANVMARRWTASYKAEIRESRTESSKLLVKTLHEVPHKIQAIISSSAIGWYGEDKVPGHFFEEHEPAYNDFLGQTTYLWEQSIEPAEQQGVRVCTLRTGIVLSDNGGALKEFETPLRFGIAPILGDGKQMLSWIHINDLCRMFHFCMTNSINGSLNAVTPYPVTSKLLTLTLAKTLRGKFFIPFHVPSPVLKLMLGERSIEILKSCTVSSQKVLKNGFKFSFQTVEDALKDLYSKKP